MTFIFVTGDELMAIMPDEEDFWDVFTFVRNHMMHNDVDLQLTPRVLTMTVSTSGQSRVQFASLFIRIWKGDFDFDKPLTFDEWQALDDDEPEENQPDEGQPDAQQHVRS
jgi:hypothetical protein